MDKLECLFCQKYYPHNFSFPFCPDCSEPLLFSHLIKKGKIYKEKTHPLEKFIDFLPLSTINQSISLGEKETPLIRQYQIEKNYDLPVTFVKNETFNPTHSFKDRGTAVAVQKAVSMGVTKIGTVSTGNMAASTAAYGAKAGLETYVLLKEETSQDKLLESYVAEYG